MITADAVVSLLFVLVHIPTLVAVLIHTVNNLLAPH